jgi:aminoglycoside 6'-N-acetyltransferase I
MGQEDLELMVSMGQKLFPEASMMELREGFSEYVQDSEGVCLLCRLETGEAIGFVELSVRHDYVEGSTSSPVPYVEGIYVEEAYRGKGVARALIESGYSWAKSKGYTEMGSDVELHNTASMTFHEAIGFKEANRIVSYIKTI